MSQYTLFFSWQNDRKDTRSVINAALREAKAALEADGIELVVDQDTRNRTGKRNIDAEVLDKIRRCDIFLADLTPVVTYTPAPERHDLPKHMPNSNVMYEYGYALHAKGENRMLVLASLNKDDDEHIEFMPFDINHDTIMLFTDLKSLGNLHLWIRNIIKDVDKERAKQVPAKAGSLHFMSEGCYYDEITIHPRYKKIRYRSSKLREITPEETVLAEKLKPVTDTFDVIQAFTDKMMMPQAKLTQISPLKSKTNHSRVLLQFVFTNDGAEALDNLEISIMPGDSRVSFADSNVEHSSLNVIIKGLHNTNIGGKAVFQHVPTLNPRSVSFFDNVYVHAPHDIGSFNLNWSLNSRDHAARGVLTVHVEPDYEYDTEVNDELAGNEQVVDLIKEE